MGHDEKVREGNKVEEEIKFEATRGMETFSEIDKLTDDCLIEIFQYLTTIADKIRIGKVCKRWQSVSQKSWNNFKSLDFSAKTWGIDANRPFFQLSINIVDFEKIIRLSGRYLTKISTSVGIFAKVSPLLPNIRELQLIDDCNNYYVPNSAEINLSWLTSHGKNITFFQMELAYNYCKEEDFVRVLGEMKQLKTFYLYSRSDNNLDWSGICLLELPFEEIQEIILDGVIQHADQNIFSMMLEKCKKLQTFSTEDCLEDHLDEILKALSLQADTLKNLSLQFFDFDNQSVLLSRMSALIHLEKLDVSYSRFITDAFLDVVSKNCKKLTYLNLHECHTVTDVGISSICNLERLTYLNISFLPKVRNPPLKKLTSLVVLDASWYKNIQEECLCSFLKNAPQLRALNVNFCSFVTNKLLNAAVETAKIRNPNNKLDLYADGTYISLKFLSLLPPLVNLLSSHYLPIAKYGVKGPFPIGAYPEVEIANF